MEGATPERASRFKTLCLAAANKVADGRHGYGILSDGRIGRDALYKAANTDLWIGRPVEWPASRPLALEPEIGPDFGGLANWPANHVVKVLCFYHPGDDAAMKQAQEDTLTRLFAACRRNRLEMLLEIIPSKVGPTDDGTAAQVIERIYEIGIYPDWWKLEPLTTTAAWQNVVDTIERHDQHTRGIVVLGLEASEDALAQSFEIAASHDLVKGFAVGRTIFADTARAWFKGELTEDDAIDAMADRYNRLCLVWDKARQRAGSSK
jgi:5-dehydro-2-deoxygluconokinase